MFNIIKKINNKFRIKKYTILLIAIFCFVSLIIFLKPVAAEVTAGNVASGTVGAAVATLVGWITSILSAIIGLILTLLIKILVNVAQFNNIINVEAVTQGWVIVRDLCNMFFILILLVVAFATILRIESYQWKKILPKLLIMAVLINFSKTICGLIIDFSQVIMLTFVNGFSDYGAANFINLFNIQNYQKIEAGIGAGGEITNFSVAGAFIAGLLAMIITTIVVLVMLAVLVMRVVMLWVYVILSPIAFLAAAFPAGQKYSSQWWGEFSKNVIVGPVLAFFIWLALVTAQKSAATLGSFGAGTGISGQTCAGINSFFCEGSLQTYIITIGLLIGGLIVTQQIGGVGSSMAAKGLGWAKRAPLLIGKGSMSVGGWGARKFALFKGFEYGGKDKETGERKRFFKGFEIRPTKIYQGIKEGLEHKAKLEEGDVQAKAGAELRGGRILGALGASRDFTETAARGFMWHNAWTTNENGAIWSTFMAGRGNKKLRKKEEEKRQAEKDWKADEGNEEKYNKVLAVDDEIKKIKEGYEKYKAPYTFFADAKRMELIDEHAKKLGDNDNEEDLIEKFMDAIKNKDKGLAAAVFLHAAKVGHSNEALEMVKVLDNVKNDKGEIVSSKDNGDTFTADNAGLKGLVNQYFVGKLGMNKQEALALQSQFSTLAKKANHYNLSESVGSKNGLLYQRGDTEQANRAVGEMMKRDVEQLLRQFNRLGHGGEIQYKMGEETKRVSDFNQQSESAFFKLAASWHQEVVDRQRLNMNEAQNLYNTYKVEQEINGIKDESGKELFAPNEELEKAITNKSFRSILTAVKQSGNENGQYADKNNASHTYRELALRSLRYGKTKYEAATLADLNSKLAIATSKNDVKEVDRLNAEIKREKEINSALGKKILEELIKCPGYKASEEDKNVVEDDYSG